MAFLVSKPTAPQLLLKQARSRCAREPTGGTPAFQMHISKHAAALLSLGLGSIPMVHSFTTFSPRMGFDNLGTKRNTARRREGVPQPLAAGNGVGGGDGPVEYEADGLTSFLGQFLPSEPREQPKAADLVLGRGEAKKTGLSSAEMAGLVDAGLCQHGWFVTGKVDSTLFSDTFEFSDPSVALVGVDGYAEGVAKLFNQETSRCDVIGVAVPDEGVIVVDWRLEGGVNLPLNPKIKPYVVTTTFQTDKDGLICSQLDEFSIESWDIFLSALLPWAWGFIGAKPAPPVATK